jgi:hypothetical protein
VAGATQLSPRLRRGRAIAVLAALGAAWLWTPPARAQHGQGSADGEIVALIQAVGQSGCRFSRNGRWHTPAQARDHLQRKYDWARRKGLDGSAEDFIERAASRSSLSGRAYRIACPGHAELDAATWFTRQLARLRTHAAPR